MSVPVIVPTYNSAATIEDTLKSLLASDSLHLLAAVYISDDGSSDDTIQIVKEVWKSPIPIHIIRYEKNLGQWENVNRALLELDNSGFEWTLILHSDDVVKLHWLAMMDAALTNHDPELATICASWDDVLPDGKIILGEDVPNRENAIIVGTSAAVHDTLLKGCWWHISGCAINIKAYKSIGAFEPQYTHNSDYEWLLRTLSQGWTIKYIPRTLILYRQHPQSVSSKSMRYDLDLRQYLQIRWKYRAYLTRHTYIKLNFRTASYPAIRRTGRAIVNRDFKRIFIAIETFVITIFYILAAFKNIRGKG